MGGASISSIFRDVKEKANLPTRSAVLASYQDKRGDKVIEDFQKYRESLLEWMISLSIQKGKSEQKQTVCFMYQQWYYVDIIGCLLVERSRQIWKELQEQYRQAEHKKHVLETSRLASQKFSDHDLEAYERATLQYSQILKGREGEIAKVRFEANQQKINALKALEKQHKFELNRLRQDIIDLQQRETEMKESANFPASSSQGGQEETAKLRKSLEAAKEQSDTLKREKETLSLRVRELEKSATKYSLEKDLQVAINEREKATAQHRKLLHANQVLQRQVDELNRKQAENRRTLAEANTKLQDAIRDKNNLERQKHTLSEEVQQKSKELIDERAINKKRERTDIEITRQSSLEEELKSTKARLDQVSNELDQSKRQLRTMEADQRRKQSEREQRKKEQDAQSKDQRQQSSQYKKKWAEEAEARGKAERDLKQSQQEGKQLKQNLEGSAKRIKDLEAKNTENERSVKALEQQIGSLKKAESELMQQNQRLEAQIQELKKSPKDEQLIEKLTKQVEKLQSKNSDLRDDLERADHQSHMLQIRRRDNQIAQLKEQLKDQQALVRTKERQNQETYDEYRKETRDNEETIAYLRRKINELEEKVAQYE